MNRKIVFFDIDGTIYRPHTGITQKTKQAIKALTENGHYAFLATGRPYCMVTKEFLDLDITGVNAACGTYITCNDNTLLNYEISSEALNETISAFEKHNVDALFEGSKGAYYNGNLKSIFIEKSGETGFFDLKPWQDFSKLNINKMSIQIYNRDEFAKVLPVMNKYYDIIDRKSNLIEAVPKGYSKASGIKYLIEKLNVLWENTYAFGDSENDLDMMKYVKNSIAMGNSVSDVINVSRYMTETIEKDGVYNGLKVLGLI